jgi:hypothetical protein
LPDLAPEAGLLERLDAAMAVLGDDDEQHSAEQSSGTAEAAAAADPAPSESSASGESTQTEQVDTTAAAAEPGASSAIEAPATFSAELKERFAQLPPDLQRSFAQWETERNRGVSTKLQASAETQKALEAERAAIQSERQRTQAALDNAILLTKTFNPIIAEGLKMTPADWSKLAHEDKALFIEKRASFDAEVANFNSAMAERDRLQSQQHGQRLQHEQTRLMAAIPELSDPKKAQAFAGEINASLKDYGFAANEINSVVDHRMILVLRDAMKYRAGEAARAKAATKVVQTPGKVVRPGSGTPSKSKSEGLINTARTAGNLHDQAKAIAALLDD